jgi:hypothetical protein
MQTERTLKLDSNAQPSAISIRDVDSGWNRAPVVSSSALLQPTQALQGIVRPETSPYRPRP